MALKGNLRDFSIVQLLNLINLARKTGTLRIDRGTERAHLSFRGGKLVYAMRDENGGQLIPALRQSGMITEEQARTIRSRAGARSDKELGLLLINAGYVSQKDILESMRARVLDNVYPLFRWGEGAFHFASGDPQVDGLITVRVDLENLIMQGTRRLEEWERLQEDLPDLQASLKFADRPQTSLRDINLNVQEWRVISFINPRNTIQQIAQYNNMSDFQIRKIVYGLLQAGLVEIVRPEAKAPRRAGVSGAEARPKQVSTKKRRPDVKRNVIMRLIDRIREL
jgi:hypothetical protein